MLKLIFVGVLHRIIARTHKDMSEVSLVAITSAASLLTVLISRIRFIWRPCSDDPENGASQGVRIHAWIEKRTKSLWENTN